MRFCTECGARLADDKNFCTQCGKPAAIPQDYPSSTIKPTQKTACIHVISGSTKYLLKETRPIRGKNLTTIDELHHLHDHCEEIIAEMQATLGWQYDERNYELSDKMSRFSNRKE